MLGLFGIFGRSPDLKALNQERRDAGLQPRTVPETVKRAAGGIPAVAFADTVQLLGFCMIGRDQLFANAQR